MLKDRTHTEQLEAPRISLEESSHELGQHRQFPARMPHSYCRATQFEQIQMCALITAGRQGERMGQGGICFISVVWCALWLAGAFS